METRKPPKVYAWNCGLSDDGVIVTALLIKITTLSSLIRASQNIQQH